MHLHGWTMPKALIPQLMILRWVTSILPSILSPSQNSFGGSKTSYKLPMVTKRLYKKEKEIIMSSVGNKKSSNEH